MYSQEQRRRHHSHHDYSASTEIQSRGPAMFYGYCHQSGRMRMMDLPDYVDNTQMGYSNIINGMSSVYSPYTGMPPGAVPAPMSARPRPRPRHDDCECRGHGQVHEHGRDDHCHEHGHGWDCHCSCCIRCADIVEYTRCEEIRVIPVTFENDTRRERDVKLELGPFVTESGKELWQGAISEQNFKLPPCGEKTVLIRVQVSCNSFDPRGEGTANEQGQPRTVDSCKVAYATLRADGCAIRPLVIALAVLPNDCGAHHAGCQCGCCC